VIYYDYCADLALDTVNAFVHEREMGRLVTVTAEGLAHIGLYPFAYEGNRIEVHLNRKDEQIADLRTSPRCIFEVDEVLGGDPILLDPSRRRSHGDRIPSDRRL